MISAKVNSRPLRERTLSSSKLQVSSEVRSEGACKRGSYKQYDESKLYKAYEAVQSGKLSIRRAALEFSVPLSTLSDRITGKVPFGKKGGHPQYLTESEESELENFIVRAAQIGYGFGRKEIIALVQELLDNRTGDYHKDIKVTHGWWDSFRRRHPDIVLRQPEPMSRVRHMAAQTEILQKYFEELRRTLLDNDLIDRPGQIFNMDECGFPLDPKSPFVACKKGEKHPTFVTTGGKTHITVAACCSASGYSIPPLVIFDRKILKAELTIGEVPGTMYGLTSSGWIDSEIFHGWLCKHFLPHAPGSRPLLLLLDGHSSHYCPDMINKAAEEKIIIFCLPPHTTHRTQPLDKGCFSPLKAYWKEECHNYLRKNPGKVITRFQFNQVFSRSWMKGMTMKNVTSGFKTTGIFPFNPEALIPDQSSHDAELNDVAKKHGINYLPLYSSPRTVHSKEVAHVAASPDISFTSEEQARFQRRLEENYDIPDARYDSWLKRYHPSVLQVPKQSTPADDSDVSQLSYKSSLSSFLSQKVPEIKVPTITKNNCGRVLTSSEQRKIMDEKKAKKDMEMALKEQRKTEREKRKAEKEAQKVIQKPRVASQPSSGRNRANSKGSSPQPSIGTRGKSKGTSSTNSKGSSPQPSLSICVLINQIIGHAPK